LLNWSTHYDIDGDAVAYIPIKPVDTSINGAQGQFRLGLFGEVRVVLNKWDPSDSEDETEAEDGDWVGNPPL